MRRKILRTLKQPKRANYIEIYEQRLAGMTVEDLADWHDLSGQRIRQIINSVETKIRDGTIAADESPVDAS